MKKIFSILAIFGLTTSHACEVNLHKYIYKISDQIDYKVIKRTDCPKPVINKLLTNLSNIEGKLPSRIFEEQLRIRDFKIIPKVIHISTIENLVNENIELRPEKTLKKIESLTNLNQIQSDTELLFSVQCKECYTKIGKANIKVQLDNKNFWFTGSVSLKKAVWIAKKPINSFSTELSPNMFEQKVVYLDKDIETFQDVNNIKFYKTTKSLKAGDVVTSSHLAQRKLVKAFSKVRLKVVGSTLELSTTAKAQGSGFLDEFIEVKNIKSNKKFLAKIIDFNTVEIEL